MYWKVSTFFYSPSIVTVECQISKGLPSFNIIGLASKSIQESKERIKGALNFIGINLPPKKITINLHPIDIIKQGNYFDLPIAITILKALKYLKISDTILIAGELALNGKILKVRSILSFLLNFKNKENSLKNFDYLVLPYENIKEISVLNKVLPLKIKFVDHLNEVIELDKVKILSDFSNFENEKIEIDYKSEYIELFDSIKGQELAKYALAVAGSGKHNVLMVGPPGTGKSILSKSALALFDEPSEEEFLEISQIYNLAGYEYDYWIRFKKIRPYRSPHHTSSYASIVGGSKDAKVGEITLAHNGILFLDEFPEFNRNVIEALREPLENKKITISRVENKVEYPANFVLIAAMNPCSCGYYKTNVKDCTCTISQISKYWSKISGPILDRIDLFVEVSNITFEELSKTNSSSYTNYLHLTKNAKKTINQRKQLSANGQLSIQEINEYCMEYLTIKAKQTIEKIYEKNKLSIRKFHKILKISRTIADMQIKNHIDEGDILTAYKLSFNRYTQNF